MKPSSFVGLIGLVALLGTLALSCGKKKGADDDTKETTAEGTDPLKSGQVGISSEFAESYPVGLAVSAFPLEVDATPGTAAAGTVKIATALNLLDVCPPSDQPQPDGCTPPDANQNICPPPEQTQPPGCVQPTNAPAGDQAATDATASGDYDPFQKHPKELLDASKARLEGTAENCFDDDIVNALTHQQNATDACFGFDYGIVSGSAMGIMDGGQVNPTLSNLAQDKQSVDGVKEALASIVTQKDTTSEACMVRLGRQVVEQAASRVTGTLRVVEAMLCQAKKDGTAKELPAVGASLDLKAVFASYQNATFTEATLARLEDRDGRAVYRSKLTFTVKNGDSPLSFTLVHSPADGNATYDGVLWIEGERTDDENKSPYAVLTNISYSKTGTTATDQNLKMEIRAAEFNKNKVTAEYIGNDGRIDFNAGADSSGNFGAGVANDYLEGIRYFAFDINPSSYAGKISFWVNPGGNYEEAARGFSFESSQAEDGTLSGCAFAGAARDVSIRKAIKEGLALEPTGCFTPQLSFGACGKGHDNVGTQVWKQCFKQGSDGIYKVDTDKVTDKARGFDVLESASAGAPTVDVSTVGSVGDVK